jgi:hypothetical protein
VLSASRAVIGARERDFASEPEAQKRHPTQEIECTARWEIHRVEEPVVRLRIGGRVEPNSILAQVADNDEARPELFAFAINRPRELAWFPRTREFQDWPRVRKMRDRTRATGRQYVHDVGVEADRRHDVEVLVIGAREINRTRLSRNQRPCHAARIGAHSKGPREEILRSTRRMPERNARTRRLGCGHAHGTVATRNDQRIDIRERRRKPLGGRSALSRTKSNIDAVGLETALQKFGGGERFART